MNAHEGFDVKLTQDYAIICNQYCSTPMPYTSKRSVVEDTVMDTQSVSERRIESDIGVIPMSGISKSAVQYSAVLLMANLTNTFLKVVQI